MKGKGGQLTTMLRALGNSPSKIAQSLERRKIKGVPEEAGSCPLAEYVKHTYNGDIDEINVDDLGVKVTLCVSSKALSAFVSKFDKGEYPKLVKGAKA